MFLVAYEYRGACPEYVQSCELLPPLLAGGQTDPDPDSLTRHVVSTQNPGWPYLPHCGQMCGHWKSKKNLQSSFGCFDQQTRSSHTYLIICVSTYINIYYIKGLVQNCGISLSLAMKIPQSCTRSLTEVWQSCYLVLLSVDDSKTR